MWKSNPGGSALADLLSEDLQSESSVQPYEVALQISDGKYMALIHQGVALEGKSYPDRGYFTHESFLAVFAAGHWDYQSQDQFLFDGKTYSGFGQLFQAVARKMGFPANAWHLQVENLPDGSVSCAILAADSDQPLIQNSFPKNAGFGPSAAVAAIHWLHGIASNSAFGQHDIFMLSRDQCVPLALALAQLESDAGIES